LVQKSHEARKKVYPEASLVCFGTKELLAKAKQKVEELIDPKKFFQNLTGQGNKKVDKI